MFVGPAVRALMLVMAVWLLVSLVAPTADSFVVDLGAAAVLAVLALISPVRRFLVRSVLGRPNSA